MSNNTQLKAVSAQKKEVDPWELTATNQYVKHALRKSRRLTDEILQYDQNDPNGVHLNVDIYRSFYSYRGAYKPGISDELVNRFSQLIYEDKEEALTKFFKEILSDIEEDLDLHYENYIYDLASTYKFNDYEEYTHFYKAKYFNELEKHADEPFVVFQLKR